MVIYLNDMSIWSNLSLVFTNDKNNIICKTTLNKITSIPISRWQGQRPPDINRIREISNYIKHEKCIDGIIYLYEDIISNKFYCYDGLHRLEAIRILIKNNYTENLNILLSIKRNTTDGYIKNHFDVLNKCIPVPDIYTGIRDANIITTIEAITNEYVKKYPNHFSTTRNPNIPNENKDRMKDRLKYLIENNPDQDFESQYNLISFLECINEHIRNNIPHKCSTKQIEKCKSSGLYLFLQREWHTTLS